MPLPKEEIYTIDDIYALPEGESGIDRWTYLLYGSSKQNSSEDFYGTVKPDMRIHSYK